tara:strand:+ start:60336 stop:61082 length:747 start_codon:yes stop_codon:yes gene_type:complete
MFTRQKTLMVLGMVLGAAACGVPGGQEPAQEPVQSTAPSQQAQAPSHQHKPVAWSRQGPTQQQRPTPSQPTPNAQPAPTQPQPTPVAQPTPPAASKLPAAYQEILSAHNEVRARHCAAPLKWSSELQAVAQDWADQLAGANCAFEHRKKNRFGENLTFFAPVGSQSPKGVANGWYSEVQQYDFNNGQFDFQTGHFTQVVWTSTTELGCGVSRCNGGEIWVCNYNPPGNMMGDFASRVLHPNQCAASGR